MPAQHPEVSILIVSYNTREMLRGCLKSLERIRDEAESEIVIVDNASSDDSAKMIRDEFPDVKIIQSSENIGFASGVNLARESANGEYLFVLNPDCLVPRFSIRKLVDFLSENPIRAIAGASITAADGSNLPSEFTIPTLFREFWNFLPELKSRLQKLSPIGFTSGSHARSEAPRQVEAVSGAAFMIRASHFDQVGGMDEEFFLYHEELDLCTRLRSAGLEVWLLPAAQVIHFDAQASGYTTGKLAKSPVLEWRVMGMNRLWEKHRSPAEHRRWQKLASRLLEFRIVLLRLKKPFAHHESRQYIVKRMTSLRSLVTRLESVEN